MPVKRGSFNISVFILFLLLLSKFSRLNATIEQSLMDLLYWGKFEFL